MGRAEAFVVLLTTRSSNLYDRSAERDMTRGIRNTWLSPVGKTELKGKGTLSGITRGIRNNNPLNIRYACNNWQGKITKANKKDPSFEEFETMRHGFRAALLLIQNYIIKYGCNTISKIITRWAPSSDVSCCKECAVRIKAAEHPPLQSTQACIGCDKRNNTAKYIQDVCRLTNMGGNEVLSNHDPRLKEIVRAMSLIESGTDIRDYWSALDVAWEEFKPKSVYQKERKPVGRIK